MKQKKDLPNTPAVTDASEIVRAQLGVSHLAHEARVAELVSESFDFVIEGTCPYMGVVGETPAEVGDEGLKRIRCIGSADSRLALPAQVRPDRLTITAQVVGDGGDRPTPFSECLCFHVFSLSKHGGGPLRLIDE